MKSLMALWVSFVMLFVNFVPGFTSPEGVEEADKTYPYIFIHGFMGWGEDEGIDEDFSYWGATACHLITNLNNEGYECYDASVGPLSSNWDRACELYAQLTGTRVDYGAAHAEKFNHSRYGRTYAEPVIDGWGEADENGRINKINLIGHSFGGNTARLLTNLLANGCREEVEASGDDASSLFRGGKGNWVNSLVAICSPNNGTSLAYIAFDMEIADPMSVMAYYYAGIMGRSSANGYVDFHLEQFGLTNIPGEDGKPSVTVTEAVQTIMEQRYDNFAYDMSPHGAMAANASMGTEYNIYYFSYPFSTTVKSPISDCEIPLPSTLSILAPFSIMMGMYSGRLQDEFPIDKSWLDNDGLVNVVSASYPIGSPHKSYDSANISAGIWNVMPLSTGDHGNAIGIGVSEEATMDFYNGMLEMIESLPITD